MTDVVNDMKEKVATIVQGGTQEARERHQGKGKMLARDRINLLVDPGCVPCLASPAFMMLPCNRMHFRHCIEHANLALTCDTYACFHETTA